jgi:hypothetical protein
LEVVKEFLGKYFDSGFTRYTRILDEPEEGDYH